MKGKRYMRKSLVALAMTFCMVMTCTGLAYAQSIEIPNHMGHKSDEKDYVEGEAIVLFSTDDELSTKSAKRILSDAPSEIKLDDIYRVETSKEDITDTIALVSSDETSTEKLVSELNKVDGIELAEPNYIVKACDNGKYFENQWHLMNNGQNAGTAGEDINYEGRPASTGEKKVVAVIDTGVDYTHPDLRDVMWMNDGTGNLVGEYGINTSEEGEYGDPKDDNGHGTHCAGTIAGQGSGINGIASDVEIMALKFLDSEGGGDIAGALACYEYISKAIDEGVNVVAVNDSWGGDEESDILTRMINKVGEKGCVSVVAAGNESTDYNTEEDWLEYPACTDSPYVICVAASDEKGNIASFSNRGSKYVDIAAPGTTILSATCNYTYNPTIYGGYDSEMQQKLSAKFNNFNDDTECELNKDFAPAITEKDAGEGVTVSTTSDMNLGAAAGGSSMKFKYDSDGTGYFTSRIPYTVGERNEQFVSVAFTYNAPESTAGFFDTPPYFMVVDAPKGAKVTPDNVDKYECMGYIVSGESSGWDVINLDLNLDGEKAGSEREVVFLTNCVENGTYELYLDNIGISSEDVKCEDFGKYEFMSGTSMAAPVVAGVVASMTEGKASGTRSVETIQKTLKNTDVHAGMDDAVLTGGVVQYGNDIEIPYTTIVDKITVDTASKKITIKGYGFDKDDIKVEIQKCVDGAEYEEADIVSKDENELVIDDNDWINRHVNIKVTADGKETVKEYVYLVNGKKEMTSENVMMLSSADAYTTDGTNLYFASNYDNMIYKMNIASELKEEMEEVEEGDDLALRGNPFAEVDKWQLFKKRDTEGAFQLTFGSDMALIDNNLYVLANLEEVFPEDSTNVISRETVLIKINRKTGAVESLGKLPDNLASRTDVAMGSYNGKLYFAGGYDRKSKTISSAVNCYNPQSKAWTEIPEMPESRAAGKIYQSGKYMLYIMGCDGTPLEDGDENYECQVPSVLLFDGTTWKKSEAKIELGDEANAIAINRGGKTYLKYYSEMAQCADGILFFGFDTEGLGNVFKYSVSKDAYVDTGYKFEDPDYDESDWDDWDDVSDESTTVSTVLGNTAYYLSDGTLMSCRMSGPMVTVSNSSKYGTLSGKGKYMPGQMVTVTGKGNSGYYCKSLTVNGKRAAKNKASFRVSADTKVKDVYAKFTIKVPAKMSVTAGKSKTVKVRYSASAAKAQKPAVFSSSNKKYATVSKKGVVKAKKAGKGKTVKIKVKADKKVVKTIKVKIK